MCEDASAYVRHSRTHVSHYVLGNLSSLGSFSGERQKKKKSSAHSPDTEFAEEYNVCEQLPLLREQQPSVRGSSIAVMVRVEGR